MNQRKDSKGITLIALVITIIVLIILAGISINGLFGENGLIANVTGAKFKTEMKGYQEETNTYILAEEIPARVEQKELNINAGPWSENPNREIKEIIPDLKEEYKQKVEVITNEFYYVPLDKSEQTKKEVKWSFEVDIKVKGFDSYEDFLESEEPVKVPSGEYTAVNGVYVCSPDLTGFNPNNTYYVTYDETGKEYIGDKISKTQPEGWYSYTSEDKLWANVVTVQDNQRAYFVWIPRYVYSIDAEAKTAQSPKVKFVDKNNNYKDYETAQITNYPDTVPTYDESGNQTNFCLPEAFKWGNDGEKEDIAGYWISKYEISNYEIDVKHESYENKIIIRSIGTSGISGINQYDIYMDGEYLETITALPYEIPNLKANSEHIIKVVMKNSDGVILSYNEEMVKTLEADAKTLTTPDTTGFNPNNTYYVTYDETGKEIIGNKISEKAPDNWYDYENKQWANIITISNNQRAYFTWIPKYEYKIKEVHQEAEIRFIAKTQTGATGGYLLPEAFKWDGKDIAGYWVSKYEISNPKVDIKHESYENKIIIRSMAASGISGISQYDIYMDGKYLETVTALPYEIPNLEANSEHTIRILMRNSEGIIIASNEEMVKTLEADTKTLTTPDLTGFNPATTYYVTYDASGNEDTSIPISQPAPSNWYDYENKQWANIVTKSENGTMAYFTWIPKYEYKIKEAHQEAEIRFIAKTQTGATGGYLFPEAFKWEANGERKEISGYWVSKYEISE